MISDHDKNMLCIGFALGVFVNVACTALIIVVTQGDCFEPATKNTIPDIRFWLVYVACVLEIDSRKRNYMGSIPACCISRHIWDV